MSDETLVDEEKMRAENPSGVAVETKDGQAVCSMQGRGWLKGPLGMAICCGVPLLFLAAISLFGVSLGAIASGALSLAVVLACPVGMFLMMRMMMKGKKEDEPSSK